MSKHIQLTEKEFSGFSPHPLLITHLETYRLEKNVSPRELTVLDWGCGRGRTVLWLKEHGYNAFGIDIDQEPIQNGVGLFISKGYDSSCLKLVSSEGHTDFQDNYFDFIISDQVFEHVKNLEAVALENRRLLKNDGIGLHIYPAHYHIIEGHLFMPFIHWLPKNFLRKYFIIFFAILGMDPDWPEVRNFSLLDKCDYYYHYSINKTFYRKPVSVKNIFINQMFDVKFITIDDPYFINHPIFGRFVNNRFCKWLINWVLITFVSVELLISKK